MPISLPFPFAPSPLPGHGSMGTSAPLVIELGQTGLEPFGISPLGYLLIAFCPFYIEPPKTACSARGEVTQCRVEQDNSSSCPADSAGPDAPEAMVEPFGCQGTLLARIQLAVNLTCYYYRTTTIGL